MDVLDKITGWFQVVASVMFVLFSLFNLIRIFIQRSETFYFLCFAAMLFLSWKLLRISVAELREIKKGGKQ